MPHLWAHLIFGQEVMQKTGLDQLLHPSYPLHVFNLGCQGPDFLFYHNFWPWKKDKKMQDLGSAMHNTACGPVLLNMVQSVQGRAMDDPAVVYMLGFLLHHVLDRNVHPYIFYRSGFRKWDHQRFEVALDTLIVRRKLGLETWRTPAWKQFYTGDDLPTGVIPILLDVTQRFYPQLTETIQPADWRQAYRDMVRAQKLFHDPSGVKRRLTFGQIDPFVFKRRVAPVDFLNEANAQWHHPAILEQAHTLSVWDMWELALADGIALVKAAKAVLEANAVDAKKPDQDDPAFLSLQEAIGNVSYETGLPCDSGLEIRFADPII